MAGNKKIIVIVGPTAVGKTFTSIELAKKMNTEIISCDSRQFYKELLIGTAPPNKNQLQEVRHHFIHNLSITDNYNAGIYENDAIKIITEIHKKKDSILVVGGSGLYVDAICKGFDNIPPISINTRSKLKHEFNIKGLKWLQKEIQEIEPKDYKNIDYNNPQRLLRKLEIFRETGKPSNYFKTKKSKKRSFKIIKIGLEINRQELYKRINKRVDDMIDMGLIEEVRSLLPYKNLNALQTVGYKEIFDFFEKKIDLNIAIENIKKNSRRFAKRQLTWFKRDLDIKWFEPNQIKKKISVIEE